MPSTIEISDWKVAYIFSYEEHTRVIVLKQGQECRSRCHWHTIFFFAVGFSSHQTNQSMSPPDPSNQRDIKHRLAISGRNLFDIFLLLISKASQNMSRNTIERNLASLDAR
jgi:hypothetical protein